MGVTSIASACADLERAMRREAERQYPERLYRAISAVIDDACFEVEEVNLGGGGECPARVGALIEYLQLLAGEPVQRPGTSVAALDALFDLSARLLGRGRQIGPELGALTGRSQGYAA